MSRFKARYFIETPQAVGEAAAALAGEQSCGTFVSLPGETDELRQRAAARVESIEELEPAAGPSLPGSRPCAAPCHRAEVEISWPLDNIGVNLPALVSTVAGNLYELSQFSGIKLLDLEFPAEWKTHFPGPRFGVAGTRRLVEVQERPLIGTIIKPSVGLSPQETAEIVRELVAADIDFIKDDELMANPPHSPFDQRVDAVMRVINDHASATGKRVMFAFNITDEMDAMQRHYDKIMQSGGTCAMISLNSVGLAATKAIADRGELPIHGHRNGWGMLTRCPQLGMEFVAYQKLWRLAGVDQLHVNGIQNKFWEPDDSVVKSIVACGDPLLDQSPLLPVVSSGQWGGQAFETFRRTQTTDLLYLAGGGIFAHPGGSQAGVRALRQAWAAAVDGLTLAQAAHEHAEFAAAVAKFSTNG